MLFFPCFSYPGRMDEEESLFFRFFYLQMVGKGLIFL